MRRLGKQVPLESLLEPGEEIVFSSRPKEGQRNWRPLIVAAALICLFIFGDMILPGLRVAVIVLAATFCATLWFHHHTFSGWTILTNRSLIWNLRSGTVPEKIPLDAIEAVSIFGTHQIRTYRVQRSDGRKVNL